MANTQKLKSISKENIFVSRALGSRKDVLSRRAEQFGSMVVTDLVRRIEDANLRISSIDLNINSLLDIAPSDINALTVSADLGTASKRVESLLENQREISKINFELKEVLLPAFERITGISFEKFDSEEGSERTTK